MESNLTFDSMHVILGRPKMLNPSSSWDFPRLGSAILAPCRKGAWHQHRVSCKRCAGAKLPSADIDNGAAVLTTRHCCLIAFSILVFLRHNSSGV